MNNETIDKKNVLATTSESKDVVATTTESLVVTINKELEKLKELLKKEPGIKYISNGHTTNGYPKTIMLSQSVQQKLLNSYKSYLQGQLLGLKDPNDFFKEFKRREQNQKHILVRTQNPNLKCYFKGDLRKVFVMPFRGDFPSVHGDYFIYFDILAEIVFELICCIDTTAVHCRVDVPYCQCYNEEAIKKSGGYPMCNSWVAMMDLILIHIICEMPGTKMVKMCFKKYEWIEMLSSGLFLNACNYRHKRDSLTLKAIKTRMYKMLLQKSIDYLTRTILDKLQNRDEFYRFNNENYGTVQDLLINIEYWLLKGDYKLDGVIVNNYTVTFFKKNYDKLYEEIKKLIVKQNKLERKRVPVKPKKPETPKILKKPEISKHLKKSKRASD
jgi:hypothetical protein